MSKLSPDIERMIDQMELPDNVPSDARQAIREAIESSRYLQVRMANEISEDHLGGILIRDRPRQLGHFDDPSKSVAIDPQVFTDFGDDPGRLRDVLTFVIGHEVGHAATMEGRKAALNQVRNDIRAAYWTEQPDGFVDITGPTKRYVDFAGTDETRAEIEGWNAFASRIQGEGTVDRDQMLERAGRFSSLVSRDGNRKQFLDGVAGKDTLYLRYLSEDGQVRTDHAREVAERELTPERMAYYATYPLEVAASVSRNYQEQTYQDPYETRVDLSKIGQTPQSLEAAGLDFDGKSFSITDTASGLNWIQLRHTRDKGEDERPTIEPQAQRPAFSSDQPGGSRPGQHSSRLAEKFGSGLDTYQSHPPQPTASNLLPFSDPKHPQHTLYADAQARFPELSEARLNQVTAEMHKIGITPGWEGQAVVQNDAVWVRRLDMPGERFKVDLTQPEPPVQQTMQQVQQYDLAEQRRIAQDQQQEMARGPSGPVMGA